MKKNWGENSNFVRVFGYGVGILLPENVHFDIRKTRFWCFSEYFDWFTAQKRNNSAVTVVNATAACYITIKTSESEVQP